MSREDVGSWADGLPREACPAAVFGLGVLIAEILPGAPIEAAAERARAIAAGGAEGIADFFRDTWNRAQSPNRWPNRLRWGHSEPRRWQAFRQVFAPALVAEGWRYFTGGQMDYVVDLQLAEPQDFRRPKATKTILWLNELVRHDSGVAGLFFEDRAFGGYALRSSWHWPLRLGFLDDPVSQELLARYHNDSREWLRGLTSPVETERNGLSCDLLIAPLGIGKTVNTLRRAKARASAIVVFGAKPLPAIRAARHAIKRSGASALAFLPGQAHYDFLVELIRHISHNEYLDRAIRHACEWFGDVPLVLGVDPFINATRIGALAERWAEKLQRAGDAEGASELRREASTEYLSELGPATGILDISRERRARRAKPRYLNAAVWLYNEGGYFGDAPRRSGAFKRSHWSVVGAWVSPSNPELAEKAEPLGESTIDWDGGRQDLSAVLVAPDCDVVSVASKAMMDRSGRLFSGPPFIQLRWPGLRGYGETARNRMAAYPEGHGSVALFLLRPRKELHEVRARLMVMKDNRVLQTAILSGAVVREGHPLLAMIEDDRPRERESAIRLKTEGVIHSNLQDLEDRRVFDAALLSNDSLTGDSQFTVVSDRGVWLRDFAEIDTIARRIEDRLSGLVDSPEAFSGLSCEATVTALKQLAHEGVLIRGALADAGLTPILRADPQRLQIVAAKPDQVLPIEFIYDGLAPDRESATACPRQTDALDRGSCGDCPNRASRHFVCAARFWGMRKVIERQLYHPDSAPQREHVHAAEPSPDRERIGRPRVRLFAASDRASRYPGGSQALRQICDRLQGAHPPAEVVPVDCWKHWRECVADKSPALLVLLPHTDRGSYGEYLEIGHSDTLTNAEIDTDIVGDKPPVMVMLLGCDTAVSDIGYAKFVARFRQADAAVVIGTLTPILGRHAAPVARRLIDELESYWREPHRAVTLGDAMAAMRRSLMREGLPVGFAVVAFGDADWLLGA